MSFFHAFYFVSYTATTIGFGEVPNAFSEQQRLWTLVCIYLSVVGWTVFIGKLLRIGRDSNFQKTVQTLRFAREVRKLHEPFYIVCGYGEIGRLICSALDWLGYRVVVLEIDNDQLAKLELQNHVADMPSLVANASNPRALQLAGLQRPNCRGLVALTNQDSCNLAIAMAGQLLVPHLPVMARAETHATAASMASFGTSHIINPFDQFGQNLALAMHTPSAWRLLV